MRELKHKLAMRMVKLLNILMITFPFAACWYMYYADRILSPYYFKGNIMIVAVFMGLYIIIGHVYDGFWMSTQRVSEILYGQTLASLVCDGIMYVVICLLSKNMPNIIPGLVAFALQIIFATLWAFAAHSWYFRVFPPHQTAIIYDERNEMEKLIDEYGLKKKYDVKKIMGVEDWQEELSKSPDVDTVFLSGIHSHDRNIILKYCVSKGINVFVIPRIGDLIMSGARTMHMFHLPILQVSRYMAQPEYLFLKRVMDILLSIIALVITSPIMLATAIAIKATDRGSILYKQTRLTKNGKTFEIHKFRSMRIDAEKDGVARLSTGENDPRITSVGRFIRKCRIDELPQLIDILKGDLSIVGPRPERPEIAEQYCEDMPEFALRLQVKAGLTGYAQVYGKYNSAPYDKLQMDLMYIAHPSIIEDLKIILATVKILFSADSTEGVSEGEITAKKELGHVDPKKETTSKKVVEITRDKSLYYR